MFNQRFGWTLTEAIEVLGNPDPRKFKDVLTGNGPLLGGDLTYIALRRSLLPGGPRIALSARQGEVLTSVRTLMGEGHLAVDTPFDLERISVRFRKKIVHLASSQLRDGSIIMSLRSRKFAEDDARLFRQWFLEEVGCAVDVPMNPGDFDAGLALSYEHLFNCYYRHEVPEHLRDTLAKMEHEGWVKIEDKPRFKCTNCGTIYNQYPGGTCETDGCSGVEFLAQPFAFLQWKWDKIKASVLGTLRKCGWCPAADDSDRKVARTNYSFRILEKNDQKVWLLWPDRRLTHADIKRLQTLNVPTCVTNYAGRGANPETLRLANFGTLSIAEILALPTAELQERIDKVFPALLIASEQRRLAAAEESYRMVTETPVHTIHHDDFERHVFNMLSRIFPDAIPWGREHSGQRLPEGIFTMSYLQGGNTAGEGKVKGVYTWDCKHADDPDEGFDLKTGDRDNAALYVGYVTRSQELINFGGALQGHIFISNRFQKGQFDGVRKTITSGNPEWRGKVIFWDFDALVALYEWVRQNPEVARLRRDQLLKRLDLTLRAPVVVSVGKSRIEACHVDLQRMETVLRLIPQTVEGLALSPDLLEAELRMESEAARWYRSDEEVELLVAEEATQVQ